MNSYSSFERYTKQESPDSIYVKGFASVESVDRVGDIVDPLEFNVDTFVNTGTLLRDHKFILDEFGNHRAAGKVRVAEPAEIYAESGDEFQIRSLRTKEHLTELLKSKHPELSVGTKGLFAVAEVTNPLAIEEVEKGLLGAFSWQGITSKVRVGKTNRLKSVDLKELSLVHMPVNNQSTHVKIKDQDAKMLINKLGVTKIKFRGTTYKSLGDVQTHLDERGIKPISIKESTDGFIAVLEDVNRFEVAKSVCIEMSDCDVIAAPFKDDDEDILLATFVGDEQTPVEGKNDMEMDLSQDLNPVQKSFKFCVVDESILTKLFPNAGRTEVLKSVAVTLEDGEVATADVEELTITDEEVAALLNPPQAPAEPAKAVEAVVAVETQKDEPAKAVSESDKRFEQLLEAFQAQAKAQAEQTQKLFDLFNKQTPQVETPANQLEEAKQILQQVEVAKSLLTKYLTAIPPQDDRAERVETQKSVTVPATDKDLFASLDVFKF
jgi:hypothetical protein